MSIKQLDGQRILVQEPITVPISTGKYVIDQVTVPAGEVSDGYSIPWLVWWICGRPFGQRHLYPALVHDYLCRIAESYQDRVLADAKFFHLLHTYAIEPWKRPIFYVGVRICGRYMWAFKRSKVVQSLLGLFVAAMILIGILGAGKAPPAGWTTQATVTRVLDGDTLEVEITRKLKVRLLDCWAPEKREAAGPASTANLKRLIGDGEITLMIPVRSSKVEDVWTFGRVLGYVWSKADADWSVNEMQVRQGHATRNKQ